MEIVQEVWLLRWKTSISAAHMTGVFQHVGRILCCDMKFLVVYYDISLTMILRYKGLLPLSLTKKTGG